MKDNRSAPLSRPDRDLAWSIRSAPLMAADGVWPSASWFAKQWLPGGDGPATMAPPPERFRLGIHFERIFQHWLAQHPDYDLCASNLQIQSVDRTLGEFDLLVDIAGHLEHWELAIKFYLNQSKPEDPAQWFGPDPSDTLADKIDRLLQHQLPIAETPEANSLIRTQLGQDIGAQRAIMKGRLYYPWDTFFSGHCVAPASVSTQHLKGWWLAADEIERLTISSGGQQLCYLPKSLWLSEVSPNDKTKTLDQATLVDFLANTSQIAPQFALLNDTGNETSRGFIVKPGWFEALYSSSAVS